MIAVAKIVELQRNTVERWHRREIDNPYDGFLFHVCSQHQRNFQLWHEEDIARSPDVGDARIAEVKRNIDRYNQQRNDLIEKLDDELQTELRARQVLPPPGTRWNTETPGSAIDRLSILSLRLYHMEEQARRTDASTEHLAKIQQRLPLLYAQHQDLARALEELIEDLFAGRKVLKLYRQMKMYNDPTLNPYLYKKVS